MSSRNSVVLLMLFCFGGGLLCGSSLVEAAKQELRAIMLKDVTVGVHDFRVVSG